MSLISKPVGASSIHQSRAAPHQDEAPVRGPRTVSRVHAAAGTEAARAAQRVKRASDAAVWAAEEDTAPPLPTAAGRIGIAQLPLRLLRDGVFSYLAPPPSLAQPATMRDDIDARKYEAQLGTIRAVCQRWNRATQQSLAACEKRVQRIRFQTADANDRARILREAQTHGGDVHELAIVTGTYSGIMWNFTTGKFFCKDELLAATAWWRELLACFPHLERLNVDGVELCFMETVLSVAADVCPRVRGLVFLGGSPVMGRRPEKDEMAKLNRALADALRKWYTANGGLRLLTMPCWARYNDAAHSDVLKAVASFCPDIEYLPTWDYAGITRSNQASPHQVPVAVWRDFCRRCTKLRACSWNLCEMTPKHVGHFVASKKPHLDSLAIELGIENWKNDPKFVLIQSVLASVPTVRMLTLTFADASDWNEDSDEDTGDDTTPAEAEAGCAALDDIVRSVPLHSPKLETFACKFICDEAAVVVGGKAVKTLLGLSSLRRLEIDRCKLHENSVNEILSRADASDPTSRVDEVDSTDIPHTAIYNVLVNIAEQSVWSTLHYRWRGKRRHHSARKPPGAGGE